MGESKPIPERPYCYAESTSRFYEVNGLMSVEDDLNLLGTYTATVQVDDDLEEGAQVRLQRGGFGSVQEAEIWAVEAHKLATSMLADLVEKGRVQVCQLLRDVVDYADETFMDEETGHIHVMCGLCGDTTDGCVNHDCPMPDVRRAARKEES